MKIKRIDSSSNSLFKKLLSLTKSSGIKEEKLCLISGEKVIAEYAALENLDSKNHFWIYTEEVHELLDLQNEFQLIQLPNELFKQLDVIGSHKPLLCAPTPEIQPWNSSQSPGQHELLCALGDPNNLGALLRSAKAFGINDVVLLEECCHPFHPKAIKAASGACFGMNFYKGPSIKNLKNVENVLALDMSGKSVREEDLRGPYRILLGEEGQGLPQSENFHKVSIPYSGNVESLNATVAASILFYELSR